MVRLAGFDRDSFRRAYGKGNAVRYLHGVLARNEVPLQPIGQVEFRLAVLADFLARSLSGHGERSESRDIDRVDLILLLDAAGRRGIDASDAERLRPAEFLADFWRWIFGPDEEEKPDSPACKQAKADHEFAVSELQAAHDRLANCNEEAQQVDTGGGGFQIGGFVGENQPGEGGGAGIPSLPPSPCQKYIDQLEEYRADALAALDAIDRHC